MNFGGPAMLRRGIIYVSVNPLAWMVALACARGR